MQFNTVPDDRPVFNDHRRSHKAAFAQHGVLIHNGRRVNPLLALQDSVIGFQQPSKGTIRIRDAKQRQPVGKRFAGFERFGDNDDARFGGVDETLVLGVREKGHRSGACRFNFGKTANPNVGISLHIAVEENGQFSGGLLHQFESSECALFQERTNAFQVASKESFFQ